MNGKVGDHPLTDILVHKRPTFSEEVDRLIAEIHELGGHRELDRVVGLEYERDLDHLREQLVTLREHLRNERRVRGWEVE